MSQIRVLLVDDHTLLRQGLRNMLELNTNIQVVGEAMEGEEAVAKTGELSPDIVLMDITLPGTDGIEATRRIKQRYPNVDVVVLTMHVDDYHAFEAIRASASGYLTKNMNQEELVKAIETVYAGEASLDPAIAKKMLREFAHSLEGKGKPFGLSSREREVLGQLCQGASNKEIAERLIISQKTVKSHLKSIFNKLDVNDRTQAVAFALREGIIK